MGLSASMWTSVSGLLAHGNKMNVVGNNIANVSTIGFKSQRMDFNDYLYLNGGSTSGPTQIGAGVATYAVLGDFSQGSLESTNSGTDLAIDGEGWFKVRQPNTEQMYYTRAGDFYFNADRQLQNPEGYRLQGWVVDSQNTRLLMKRDSINLGENKGNESAFQGIGTPKDIVLDSWYIEPQRTDSISFTMGLTSDKENDRAVSASNGDGPFLALYNQWDAKRLPDSPMPDKQYATSSSIKVYDESGIAHELTVYYDQIQGTDSCQIEGIPAGYSMYEYIVTMNPEEDMRTFKDKDDDVPFNTPGSKNAGLLMTGHLIFDASGNLVNQTAYSYQGTDSPDNLGSWQPTKLSSNGKPLFVANFKGMEGASGVSKTAEDKDQLIELDFGLRITTDFPDGVSLADLKATQKDIQVKTTLGIKTVNVLYDNTGAKPLMADENGNIKNDGTGTYYIKSDTKELVDADGNIYKNAAGNPVIVTTFPADAKSKNTELGGTERTLLTDKDGKLLTNADGYYIEADDPYYLVDKNGDYVLDDANNKKTANKEVDLYKSANYSALAKANEKNVFVSDNPTKAAGKSFVTQDATANGYTSGVLSGTNITNDGVIYGYYDNGQTIPLYQIALYDFHNEQGLRREGGNLYSATNESGNPRQGVAGDNGFGVTRAYNIEGSNVDMSREFVNMITTQRGFQANSKGVTTVDTMLETVIGMKR